MANVVRRIAVIARQEHAKKSQGAVTELVLTAIGAPTVTYPVFTLVVRNAFKALANVKLANKDCMEAVVLRRAVHFVHQMVKVLFTVQRVRVTVIQDSA